MKANELMIEDWVLFSGEPKQVRSIVVSDNGVERIYAFGKTCQVSTIEAYIEPIPLTSEILEKNGYFYNEKRDAWESIPITSFGICKDEDDNCFYFCLGIFDAFNRHSDVTYHYITKVEYVHELQHILKHCKIEKEITL